MNRKEFFEAFPEAKAAFKSGAYWEYQPEYAEPDEDYYEFCLDCHEYPEGHWLKYSYHLGYRVEDKEIWCDEWRQWGGDWDIVGSFRLERNSDSKWYDQNRKEVEASHKHYAEWVAEHGEDPLDAYYVLAKTRGEERWKWSLKKDGDGFRLMYVCRLDAEGDWVLVCNNLPEEVTGYVRNGDFNWRQLKRLAAKGTPRGDTQTWESPAPGMLVITDTIWVNRTNKSYAEELKAAARRHLGE